MTFYTWFPPALLYREWRLNRGKLATAALLLLLQVVGPVITWLFGTYSGRMDASRYVQSVALANVPNSWISFASSVVVALGVLVMRQDIANGSLSYALSGPVSRRSVLRVKALYGIVAIVAAEFVAMLLLSSVYGALTHQPNVSGIVQALLGQTLVLCALYLTALAAACTTSNVILAGGGAFLAAAVPTFVGNMVVFFHARPFTGIPLGTPYPHWLNLTNAVLHQLSPLGGIEFAVRFSAGTWFYLWFLIWCAAFWRIACRLLEHAPMERWSDTFFFSRLWYVVLGGVCFLIATFFGHVLTDMNNGYVFLVWFVLFFGASWFTLKAVIRFIADRKVGDQS